MMCCVLQLARQRTEEEVRFLMARFDENKDGRLDKAEFKDALYRMVPFKSQDMGLSELTDAEQVASMALADNDTFGFRSW